MSYVRYLIELLPYVKDETESIRIAKGEYQEPTNIIEHFRKEWRSRKHIK